MCGAHRLHRCNSCNNTGDNGVGLSGSVIITSMNCVHRNWKECFRCSGALRCMSTLNWVESAPILPSAAPIVCRVSKFSLLMLNYQRQFIECGVTLLDFPMTSPHRMGLLPLKFIHRFRLISVLAAISLQPHCLLVALIDAKWKWKCIETPVVLYQWLIAVNAKRLRKHGGFSKHSVVASSVTCN